MELKKIAFFDDWKRQRLPLPKRNSDLFVESTNDSFDRHKVAQLLCCSANEIPFSLLKECYDAVFFLSPISYQWLLPEVVQLLVVREDEVRKLPIIHACLSRANRDATLFVSLPKNYLSFGILAIEEMVRGNMLSAAGNIMYRDTLIELKDAMLKVK